MKSIIRVIILSFISFNSWSSLYPILSDIKVKHITSSYDEITFTQMLVDIGPAGDVLIRDSGNDTYMGLGTVWGGNGGNYHFYQAKNPTLVKRGDTFSTAALRVYYGGHSKVTMMNSSQDGHAIGNCVGYAATIPTFGSSWINGTYYPVGLCVRLPPVGEWCKMTTPALVLDHGRLSVEEAAGHSASDKLNIACSTGTALTLRLMNSQKYVLLSGGARSDIFVDGQAIGGPLRMNSGNNILTISDKLTGVTEPGELNGIAVLVIEPI
nr:hypothetical protein [uncultured Moellerella sp.]